MEYENRRYEYVYKCIPGGGGELVFEISGSFFVAFDESTGEKSENSTKRARFAIGARDGIKNYLYMLVS